jgi:adenylosuccinate lyase
VLDALLAAGASREGAYAIVQRYALRATDERRSLHEVLEADPEVTAVLDRATLEACFDDAAHLGHVPAVIERLSRLERPSAG